MIPMFVNNGYRAGMLDGDWRVGDFKVQGEKTDGVIRELGEHNNYLRN